jgi:hypothetical protein
MLRRGVVALLSVLAVLQAVVPAAAQQQATPLDFLKSIYEPYSDSSFKGQPYDREPRRFFAPDLAAAMERDFADARKRGEVPALDGDPFIESQEGKAISAISYSVPAGADRASATGTVKFVHLGAARAVTLRLVMTPQGWRIADIVVGGGGSLRALYKLK